ncbi:hypothetical protein GCM10011501_18520 [Thalassotalea profundi]|uniref:CopL family metal-binding regulatory protein n=2 Tax=Thalassotalea profundi TaxID=2036687 RepID=A0ABQ3IRB7_9GAMM|nr:hypothetical protein GCM10011501_18520 [Thalassotalea profundi]
MASTAMSYHMLSMQGMNSVVISDLEQAEAMTQMNHANHTTNNDEMFADSDETLSTDCCNHSCDCYTGSCSTNAVALIKDIESSALSNNSSKIQYLLNSLLKQQLSSLYRPPIFS